jgi:protein tyrosine phosphatase (PTP) superfamily phosphohydrolase (DUF442 family)
MLTAWRHAMNKLETIRGYLRLDDQLATSGMPKPEHFAAMHAAGFEAVINLALPTSDHAMPNEGELVSAEGMTYVHIPVKFDAPQSDDFERFCRAMDAFTGRPVFVHCAANMRVSAFVFLYRLRRGSVDRAEAERDLRRIWEPDDVWRGFINRALTEWKQPPLGV